MMQENTKLNESDAAVTKRQSSPQSNAAKEEKKKKREQNAAKRAERLAKKEERMAKRKARMAAKKARIAARREERKLKLNKKKDENTMHIPTTSDDALVRTEEGNAESMKGKAEEIASNILKEEQRLIVEARKQARQKFLRDVKGQPALRKAILQQLRCDRQKSRKEAQLEKKKQRQERNRQRKKDMEELPDQVSSLSLHGQEWEEVKGEPDKDVTMTGN